MMLVRFIRSAAILAVIGLLAGLLIPGDPKNALFLGLSPTRLALLAGFAGLAGLFSGLAYGLKRHPHLNDRLETRLLLWLQRPAFKEGFSALAALVILLALVHLAAWLLITDVFQKAILLRLLPASLLAGGLGVLAFSLEPLADRRSRWAAVILLSLFCAAGGGLLQTALLGTIARPYVRDADLLQASRLAALLAAFGLSGRLSSRSRRQQLTWGWITALILALYLIQWFSLPAKYWPSLRDLALAGPLIILGGSLLVLACFDLWDRLGHSRRARATRLFQLLAIIALLGLVLPFLKATSLHSQILNYTADFVDQAEYLLFAKTAALQHFQTTGDHNRMPLYPFFLALFYRPGMSDTAFFELGKTVNVWLSLTLLVLIFWFVRKYLSLLTAALFTAIAAYSLYIFKAPYIQSESLYYFLALVGFTLSVRLLVQPEVKLAAALGIVLGLAHLTKASVLPGLLLFAAVFILKELVEWVRLIRTGFAGWDRLRPGVSHLATLGLALVCFLVVIFPYIRAMKARFGHYFYNVNTTFYIWYDSNSQAIEAEAQHHFAERWPTQLAPDELPGLAKYLREHSLAQVLERIQFGLQSQATNLLDQFSVTNYQLSYLAILAFVFLADLRRSIRLVQVYPAAVLFSVLYFLGYLAAFVWYAPISPERRFTYGLYLPFLLSVFVALDKISAYPTGERPLEMDNHPAVDTRRLVEASHFIIFLTLSFNIYLVLVERMFFDRYGS